jgi:hypothetical protein
MERTAWTDERLSDEFRDFRTEMRAEFADLRTEMRDGFREVRGQTATLQFFVLGGLITILAAVIALHG